MNDMIHVRAKNFWEFRKLLRLSYDTGYSFASGYKYSVLYLYYFSCPRYISGWNDGGVDGLKIDEECKTLMYIEKYIILDTIDFDEYLRIIHGLI